MSVLQQRTAQWSRPTCNFAIVLSRSPKLISKHYTQAHVQPKHTKRRKGERGRGGRKTESTFWTFNSKYLQGHRENQYRNSANKPADETKIKKVEGWTQACCPLYLARKFSMVVVAWSFPTTVLAYIWEKSTHQRLIRRNLRESFGRVINECEAFRRL